MRTACCEAEFARQRCAMDLRSEPVAKIWIEKRGPLRLTHPLIVSAVNRPDAEALAFNPLPPAGVLCLERAQSLPR